MVTKLWRGDAPAVAQVTQVTPASVNIGDMFSLTINGKTITVTATAATPANVVSLFVTAIGSSAIVEFGEVAATASGDILVLTAATAGVPFVVTGSASNGSTMGVTVATTTEGVAGANAVQSFSVPLTGTGTFVIYFGDQVTSALSIGATAAAVDTALELLTTIGAGNVTVTKTDAAGGNRTTYAVTFAGTFAGLAVATMTVHLTLKTPWCDVTQEGSHFNPVRSEIQTIRYPDTLPNGYTTIISLVADTSAAVDLNMGTAASLKALIDGFAAVDTVDVTKTDRSYTITFTGIDANANQATFGAAAFTSVPADANSIYYIAVTNAAPVANVNEVQVVTLTGTPTGGTFTLTYSGQTTSAIAYNAAPATVDAALEALSTIGLNNVSVTGSAGGPWTVTFIGTLAATNAALMTGSGASLTGGSAQALTVTDTVVSSGPNHWETAANWLPVGVPVSGDAVVFDFGNSDCLYGLLQTAVTLLSLKAAMSWRGKLGLPRQNPSGFLEYRTTELTCGITTLIVGTGEGNGPSKVAVNVGAVQSTVLVLNSGGSSDIGIPAVTWRGSHAANVVTVEGGDFGTAPYSDQTATILTFTQRGGTAFLNRTAITGAKDTTRQSFRAYDCTHGGQPLNA